MILSRATKHHGRQWITTLCTCFFVIGAMASHVHAQAKPGQKTWTDTPDWASATQVKNITWTDVPGQIQLIKNPPSSKSTPFIYIPNSASNTVTQLDTKTGKKNWTVSLDSIFKNGDPSRTTVDARGDVWVGMRNTDKVVWISAAGKIKKVVQTGKRPRAITVDLNGDVWVGNYDANTLIKINGKTGDKLFTVPMNCPYGATTDIHSNIWVVNRCKGQLTKINNKDGKIIKVSPAPDGYGIATDLNGQVWVARYGGGCIYRFNNAGVDQGCVKLGNGCVNARGIAVDGNGNVWTACSNIPLIVKVSGAGKVIGFNKQVGKHCVGMAVDADGFVWVVARGDATASKIDSNTNKLVGKYPTHGSGPYTYSDMTGFQFQNIAKSASGVWSATHSTQCNSKWLKLTWNGASPNGTSIVVQARSAATKAALALAQWSPPVANGSKPPVPDYPWIEVQVTLSTSDAQITPAVTDITLTYQATGDEICDGKDNDCDGIIDNIPGTNRPILKTCETKCGKGISPCVAGDWAVCSAPYPTLEICDGKDNDCNGKIDEGPSLCPSGSLCNQGFCNQPCESECPAGQRCTEINGKRYCVGTTPCADLEASCKAKGEVCRNGRCMGLCQGISCPANYFCDKGLCHQNDCYNKPELCLSGQICRNGTCVDNPCNNKNCPPGQQCKNGQCQNSCANVKCPALKSCKNGVCVNDPCFGVNCPAKQVCTAGKCQADPCGPIACPKGRTCVGGQCIDDPCSAVTCPAGQVCVRPQGDCFGADPGKQPDPPKGLDGGVLPEGPSSGNDPGTTDKTVIPKIEEKLSPPDLNYTPPESTGRRPNNDCVCSTTRPENGIGSLGLLMLLFIVTFTSMRRKQKRD